MDLGHFRNSECESLESGGPPPHPLGFTLIELVAVIAVIAILVAMLLPTIGKVRNYTRKVGARAEAKNIETALKQYYTEYQRWPSDFAEGRIYGITNNLALILQGANPSNYPHNPKKMQFMQFSRLNSLGEPINPWKAKAKHPYYYAQFDCNLDKEIQVDPSVETNTIVRAPVIVWTINPDADPDDSDYIIGTW